MDVSTDGRTDRQTDRHGWHPYMMVQKPPGEPGVEMNVSRVLLRRRGLLLAF